MSRQNTPDTRTRQNVPPTSQPCSLTPPRPPGKARKAPQRPPAPTPHKPGACPVPADPVPASPPNTPKRHPPSPKRHQSVTNQSPNTHIPIGKPARDSTGQSTGQSPASARPNVGSTAAPPTLRPAVQAALPAAPPAHSTPAPVSWTADPPKKEGHAGRSVLADLLQGYLLHCRIQMSAKTVTWYAQKLHIFVGWMAQQGITSPKSIRPLHLPLFLEALRTRTVGDAGSALQRSRSGPPKPFADLIIRGYAQVIKGFFTWCVTMDELTVHPFAKIPMPRVHAYVIQTFSEAHIQALLKATERCQAPVRDRALLWTLLDTGVRVSELCGLTLADVHFETGLFLVHGKGNKDREVAMSNSLKKRNI